MTWSVRSKNWVTKGLLLAVICFQPKELFTSQVFYQDIDLQQLVVDAQLVVQANFVGGLTEKYGDISYIFKVKKILKKDAEGTMGETITVREAGYYQCRMTYQARQQTGVVRSPLISRYPAGESFPFQKDKTYILFLITSCNNGEYEFAAVNGCVGDDQLKKIQKILATPPTGKS